MNNSGNVRLESFDFTKGVLIVMVVWGHFCAHSSGIGYEKNVLTSFIRLFQMPLFIFISGYFQKRVISNSDFLKRIKKTINHIGIPLLCWSIMATLVLYILSLFGVCYYKFSAGIIGVIKAIYSSFRFYWFIPCLMLCIFLNSIISLICKRLSVKDGLLYFLSAVALLLVPNYLFHFQFMWPFFILGIYIRKNLHNTYVYSVLQGKSLGRLEPALFLLLGGVFLLSLFWPTKYTFYNIGNTLFIEGYGIVDALILITLRQLLYITATILTLYYMLKFYSVFKDEKAIKYISKIGQETLFIYMFHLIIVAYIFGIVVKYVTNSEGLLPNDSFLRYYVLDLILTVIIICISHWLNGRIEKNKLMAKLLLGK